MFIFNVLLTCEFHSPKSQFVKYQCLFSMYYHYANSAVLSHNSQNVNVCVLSMYYHVLLMYFSQEREGSLMAKSPNLSAKIWYGLTVHIRFLILNLQSKFFNFSNLCLVFWQNFQRIKKNLLHSLTYSVNDAKFASFIYPFTLCFRCLPRQRTLGNSSETRSIRPQIPRITQTSCILH